MKSINYNIINLMIMALVSSYGLIAQDMQTEQQPTNQFEDTELQITVSDSVYIAGSLKDVSSDRLVIIIAGSGPTDRNCNNPAGLRTNAFLMLAEELAQAGVSSFRFDKRGIGASTQVPESTMTLDDFVSDVHKIVDRLEGDYDEIILLGHSEGALIGSMVANSHPEVHALIAVSGTSVSLDEIVLKQLAPYPDLIPMAEKHIAEVKEGRQLSEVNPMLQGLFRESVAPYLRSIFNVDPAREISAVAQPILIIGGDCDIQVPSEHVLALQEASMEAEGLVIPNMGHAMKSLKSDCSDATLAYSNPNLELHADFVSAVIEFVAR